MCHQHSGVSFFSLVLVEFRGKNCSGEGSFLSSCFTFSDTKRPFLHHKTTPHTTTSQDEPLPTLPKLLCHLSHHGKSSVATKSWAASCRDWARCHRFACLGGVGMRGRNLERGGAGGALALGGGQLMGEYNNQPKVGSTPGGVRDAQRERIIAQGRVQGRR